MADQQVSSSFWQPVYQRSDGTLYTPGVIGNVFSDLPSEVVYFGASPTPGIADVAVQKERSVDKKKGAGVDGGRLTIHGVEPATFEIRLRIWEVNQWIALTQLWPLIFVPAYKTTTTTLNPVGFQATTTASVAGGVISTQTIPQAPTKFTKTTAVTFDVTHPTLALHGIKAVQVIGGRGPDPGPVSQDRIFTIRVAEYLPPGTKNATITDEAPSSSNALTANSNPMPSNTGP